MEFQNLMAVGRRGSDVNVALFADANLIAEREDGLRASMGVESKIIKTAIC